MRCKLLLVLLIVGIACGAAPFRRVARTDPALYPSVTGPGPGVVAMNGGPMGGGNFGAPSPNGFGGAGFGMFENTQLSFQGVDGMQVAWDISMPGAFDSVPLVTPGLYNFESGKVYRLKLDNIPNRSDLVLYPTIEINPIIPRTRAYLDHNAIPVRFTDNDFDQVQQGNFVTKVIFLPAPEFQNIAVAGGVDTIVNTQLPAGADPIAEAQNRGAILAVIRMGNKTLDFTGAMGGEFGFGNEMNGDRPRVPAVPISGVNVPAFGNPETTTPYGVPGPPVLPPAGAPFIQPVFSPLNSMPSTDVPQVAPNVKGTNF